MTQYGRSFLPIFTIFNLIKQQKLKYKQHVHLKAEQSGRFPLKQILRDRLEDLPITDLQVIYFCNNLWER